MEFIQSSRFKKQFFKLSKREQIKFYEKIEIFIENEYHPALKNHKLQGEYNEYRSIDIANDIRLLYRKISENQYLFYKIGSHSELYS